MVLICAEKWLIPHDWGRMRIYIDGLATKSCRFSGKLVKSLGTIKVNGFNEEGSYEFVNTVKFY